MAKAKPISFPSCLAMFGKEKDDLVTKSEPFRIHLTEQTDAWVEQEARRTRRPKEAIVEALVEDAVRMGRFPGIAFRGPDHGRRAWLLGTALDVWEVIEAYQGFGSLQRLLNEGDMKATCRSARHDWRSRITRSILRRSTARSPTTKRPRKCCTNCILPSFRRDRPNRHR